MTGGGGTRGHQPEWGGWAQRTVWVAGLVVALGAAVTTAHGLYEVAVGAGVPLAVAWLYPIITDGLALVAYGTTARLAHHGRSYAWAVVVAAAGLSGLAQAAYLAGGVTVAPPALKFLIGAWPAIAAAIAAHLMHLLSTDTTPGPQQRPVVADGPTVGPVAPTAVQPAAPFNGARPAVQPGAQSAVQLDAPRKPATVQPVQSVQPVQRSADPTRPPAPKADPSPSTATARQRAVTAARRHAARHNSLPTVTALATLANVSRGTAAAALKHIKTQPQTLQVVENNLEPRSQQ